MQRIRPDSLFAQMQFLQEIGFFRSWCFTLRQMISHDASFFMQSTPITQVCSRDGEVNLRHSRTTIFTAVRHDMHFDLRDILRTRHAGASETIDSNQSHGNFIPRGSH